MTNSDLRMLYKRDTGNNADIHVKAEIQISDQMTLEEMTETFEEDVYIYVDDIPYVEWLEEELLKFKNLKK